MRPELLIAAIAMAVSIGLWLLDRFWSLRKDIAYRVHVNAPIAVTPSTAGKRVDMQLDGRQVKNPSLVLLRVRNAGSLDIAPEDVVRPLTFDFGEREVVGFEIAESDPPTLKEVISRAPLSVGTDPEDPELDQTHGPAKNGSRIILPRFPFNKADRFKLLVFLSGQGDDVAGTAYIIRGGVIRDGSRLGPSRRRLILGAIVFLVIGVSVGALLSLPPDALDASSQHCVPGTLTLNGSTAFSRVAKQITQAYRGGCPAANIKVEANGSLNGVQDLVTPAGRTGATPS